MPATQTSIGLLLASVMGVVFSVYNAVTRKKNEPPSDTPLVNTTIDEAPLIPESKPFEGNEWWGAQPLQDGHFA